MSTNRIERVERIFLEAAACEGSARALLIQERCGADEGLRAEVEALLAHDAGQEDQVLSAPLVAPGLLPRNLVDPDGQGGLRPGTRIGSYTIVALLGSGGMGAVYLARQETPRRTVALKVLRADAASSAVLRRMELEAEMLGRLKHPGIAQIFEAGRADYGLGPQPFFAMELVEGPPLTQYAQDRGLTQRQRLELMAKVCDAVEHAHRKGVIHRDLKPGNILVDGAGQPKVLDFGVARALDAELSVATMRTGMGAVIGTLSYMSPEQASGDPSQVDTRSDVYALGVLLYQVLSGRLPHDLTTLPLPEAARVIAESQPALLGELNRSLRGDAETIVAKAMEKDRDRRYQSAADLGDDIRRFLNGEAIEAKRDSAVYVLRKQLRRYGAVVGAVCLLIIGLSAFSVYATRQADQTRRLAAQERDAADRAKFLQERAEDQAERLRRSSYFMRIGLAQAAYAAHDAPRMARLLADCPEDLRGWEWRYLNQRADGSFASVRAQRVGPGGGSLAASGNRVAAWCAHVQKVGIWDCTTREEVASITAAGNIAAAALDATGERCAVVTASGSVELWRVGESSPLWGRRLVPRSPRDAAMTPDASRIVVAGQESTISILEGRDGSVVQRLATGSADIATVAVTPDGKFVAAGDTQGQVKIFDVESGRSIAQWPAHTAEVAGLAFSPDGTQLATCAHDSLIRLFNRVPKGWNRDGLTYRVHENKVITVAFSPDGKYLASGGSAMAIQILDLTTGIVQRTLQGHGQTVTMLAYKPDGSTLMSTSRDGHIKWWDTAGAAEDHSAQVAGHFVGAGVSPDSKTLWTVGDRAPVTAWDMSTLQPKATFAAPESAPRGFAMSPDGSMVATVAIRGNTVVWDTHTGKVLKELPEDMGRLFRADFLGPTTLVVGGGVVRAWDVRTGETLWRAPIAGGRMAQGVACDRQGLRVAAAIGNGPVLVFDGEDGREILRLPGHEGGSEGIAFAPGDRLVTGGQDGVVRVWDLTSGRELHAMKGHAVNVHSIDISPDGTRAVSGSADNTVRLWDLATGGEVLALRHHIGGIQKVLFSPDGARIISCGDDGRVRVWGRP